VDLRVVTREYYHPTNISLPPRPNVCETRKEWYSEGEESTRILNTTYVHIRM